MNGMIIGSYSAKSRYDRQELTALAGENGGLVMTFEEVLVQAIQRSGTVTSNSIHEIKCELREINRTLQFIGIQLKNLNESIAGMKQSEKNNL